MDIKVEEYVAFNSRSRLTGLLFSLFVSDSIHVFYLSVFYPCVKLVGLQCIICLVKICKKMSKAQDGDSISAETLHFLHPQVPLSLAIKITSVRGVLRIHLKPPPSDQLWFGFTSMPELEWDMESSVGDRKITNNHIASLIGNRIKVL
jgi:hypothetical protein